MADLLNLIADMLVVLMFVLAGLFVVSYLVLFNPRRTTGGWLIWRAALAVTIIGFVVLLGLFAPDWEYRPWVRVLGWGFAAYSFARLVILLFYRRFRPERVEGMETPDESTLRPKRRKS